MTTTVRPAPRRAIAVDDDRLRVGIEVRGRLVEDHEARIAQERARDRDALPLAAAQPDPVLADGRLVAVGQVIDELVRAGRAGGLDDRLRRRVRSGEPDVVGDACRGTGAAPGARRRRRPATPGRRSRRARRRRR